MFVFEKKTNDYTNVIGDQNFITYPYFKTVFTPKKGHESLGKVSQVHLLKPCISRNFNCFICVKNDDFHIMKSLNGRKCQNIGYLKTIVRILYVGCFQNKHIYYVGIKKFHFTQILFALNAFSIKFVEVIMIFFEIAQGTYYVFCIQFHKLYC